jgi:hypothetical protein
VPGALALLLALAAPAPSAQDYYRAALAQMRDIREPALVTYRTEIPAGQSTLVVRLDGDTVNVVLEMGGAAPSIHWDVAYRASDRLASVTLADGTQLRSSLSIFDPTWTGVYEWMRHGLSATAESPPPASAANASQGAPLPIIAVVNAMNPGDYTIEDAGAGDCAGRPGHALHLKANHDPQDHPLTGVTVDLVTQRFCSLRFGLRSGSAATNINSTVELDFGDAGGYYLVTGGSIESTVRALGIVSGHYVTPFRYVQMTFP